MEKILKIRHLNYVRKRIENSMYLLVQFRVRVAQPTWMDAPIYFWLTIVLQNMFEYNIFMTFMTPLWLAVGPQSL